MRDEIGIEHGQTFSDLSPPVHLRAAHGRQPLRTKAECARYHWGSTVNPAFEQVDQVFDYLHGALRDLFPAIGDARVTHRGAVRWRRARLARHRELQPVPVGASGSREGCRAVSGLLDEFPRAHAGRFRPGSRFRADRVPGRNRSPRGSPNRCASRGRTSILGMQSPTSRSASLAPVGHRAAARAAHRSLEVARRIHERPLGQVRRSR